MVRIQIAIEEIKINILLTKQMLVSLLVGVGGGCSYHMGPYPNPFLNLIGDF